MVDVGKIFLNIALQNVAVTAAEIDKPALGAV
jgi:hypothetical protein